MSTLALSLKLSAVKTLSAVQRAINILKSAGPGAWYDPSDLTTLFQDSAGTTPVTAVEQPVGLILDKSGGGNHAIQPTATSRPTLSSRYNLSNYSESFDNAAWTKAGTTVTANAVAAPDGTTTADLIVETAATSAHYFSNEVALFTAVSGTSYTQTIYAKYHSKTYLQLTFGAVKFGAQYGVFNLSTGAVASQSNGVATITDVGGGWYRCSWTATATAGGLEAGYYGLVNTTGTRLGSYAGNITIGTYVWGASLVPASDASLPYQRINTATDYDFDFFKFPPYLKFDGVDDSMYSAASIDFTSTDKMTVFAGVHKATQHTGMVYETSVDASAQNGAFHYATGEFGAAGDDGFMSRGTAVIGAIRNTFTAPLTGVITTQSNISGPYASIRENGVDISSSAATQGAGNFGNHTLFVGRRNQTSYPLNGRIYQLALKGKAMTAAEISTVEAFFNSRTKAF